jgi:hypothetical protein
MLRTVLSELNERELGPADRFVESAASGAGYVVGGAVAGAIVATILLPAPGSPETGAAAGATLGKLLAGGAVVG